MSNRKKELIEKFGEEHIEEMLDSVEMEELFECMDAFSSDSFTDFALGFKHREKHLNILEMILQECPTYLYPSVTFGVQPNTICTSAIGHLTGKKYGNVDVAIFLIQEKIKELKKWLLRDYCFSNKEIRLLHFFQDRKGVFIDELDDYYDDVDRFDIEMWFNNKSSNKKYIVVGKAERWNIKGEMAYGYMDAVYDSILEAIDEATKDCGISYLKIYENNRGKLLLDIIHHDGNNEFEIRELTEKGEKRYYNHDDFFESVVKSLANVQGYTRNVNFKKNYW